VTPVAHEVRVHCRSYTHARRFPLVIGKVGGYPLPTPLTATQVVVLLGSAGVLLLTRRVWAHLPGPADLLVQAVLPCAAAWAARHVRVEGRSPLRAAAGWWAYLCRPRHGLVNGHPTRRPRPQRVAAGWRSVGPAVEDR